VKFKTLQQEWDAGECPLAEWHDWFAWHPVTVDGERVWLEKVQRKAYHYSTPSEDEFGGMGYLFSYRPKP